LLCILFSISIYTSFLLGFDTHSNVEENLSNRFIEVNEGFQAFAAELKKMGLWRRVTTIQVSEFARTLNPNSGAGTDHAWGGNYMMMGKLVKKRHQIRTLFDIFTMLAICF